jgi:hypothetical protein
MKAIRIITTAYFWTERVGSGLVLIGGFLSLIAAYSVHVPLGLPLGCLAFGMIGLMIAALLRVVQVLAKWIIRSTQS